MDKNQFYYSKHPDVKSEPITWEYALLGNNFVFTSDNGVFSKHRVDYGSRVLLENVDVENIPDGNILDMGTGYGPIGLAIAKIQPDRVVDMVDVNEIALALAEKNAQANGISNVRILASNSYSNIKDNYAAIVTNPPVRAGKKSRGRYDNRSGLTFKAQCHADGCSAKETRRAFGQKINDKGFR